MNARVGLVFTIFIVSLAIIFLSHPKIIQAGCSQVWTATNACTTVQTTGSWCPDPNYDCISSTACPVGGTSTHTSCWGCSTPNEAKNCAGLGGNVSGGNCTGGCAPNVQNNRYFATRADGSTNYDWRPRYLNNDRCDWRNGGTLCADVNGKTSSQGYDTTSGTSWDCTTDWYANGPNNGTARCSTEYYNLCEGQTQSSCAGTVDGIWNNLYTCKWYDNTMCGPQQPGVARDFNNVYYQGDSSCRNFPIANTCGQGLCSTVCALIDPLYSYKYNTYPSSCHIACPGCNISISPLSQNLNVGGSTGQITATVSNIAAGATLNNITWNSNAANVASFTSPANPTIITPLTAGTANMVAIANLSPAGVCITDGVNGNSNPATISVTSCTPTTCAAAGISCGSIADGCGGTLNCGTCTCTITISPTSATLVIGQSTTVTATVSNISSGGTLNNITWNSANSGVASVTSPGNSTTVSGISSGSTTVTATANLSPSGNCSAPVAISVYPKSWWQVSGGDVFGANIVSNIPATCTTNCYIDLRN